MLTKELLCCMYANLSKIPGLENEKGIFLTPAGLVSGTPQEDGGDTGSKSKTILDIFKESTQDLGEDKFDLPLILKDVIVVSPDLKVTTHMDEFLLFPDQVIGVASGDLRSSIPQTSQD